MDKCLVCGNKSFKLIKTGLRDSREHDVIKCDNCEHVQITSICKLKNTQEYYDKDSQKKSILGNMDIENLENKSKGDIKRRIEFLNKKIYKNSKILEIGSGYGYMISELVKDGYKYVDGIEISKIRREIAKERYNIELKNFDITNKEILIENRYDCIIIYHVLEHIVELDNFILGLRKLLKKDGIIVLEVPNIQDYLLKNSKEYFDFYFQISHVSYFHQRTLEKIFIDRGFDIETIGVQRYDISNAYNWLVNGKPQIDYIEPNNKIDVLNNIYIDSLEKKIECDTLTATIRNAL